MNNSDKRLNTLFREFYLGQATEDEKRELFRLLELSNDDDLSDLLKQNWEKEDAVHFFNSGTSKRILNKVLEGEFSDKVVAINSERSFNTWKFTAVAASVLIFLTLSLLFFNKNPIEHKVAIKTVKTPQTDVSPGKNKAILTLGDGSTIVLDESQSGIVAKQGNILIKKGSDGQLEYIIAKTNNPDQEVSINKITTPRGGQYQIVLPDGSRVWLNAASSLSFPTVFKGKERRVECTGEAYFEIAKNTSMPFIVKANSSEVKVLGTHFNIMAYEDEKVLKTTLLEGSVEITKGEKSKKLKPGEQAIIDNKDAILVKSNINLSAIISWKKGNFTFDDEGLNEIMRKISRWYDVDIEYNENLSDLTFNGSISRFKNVSEVLKMLELTGAVHFKIEERRIKVMR